MDPEFAQLLADPRQMSGEFARAHWREFVLPLIDPAIFLPSPRPVTILTAGCTGAGKTEFSRSLLAQEELVLREINDKMRSLGMSTTSGDSYSKYVVADVDDFYLKLREKYGFTEDLRGQLNFVCIKLVEKLVDKAIDKKLNLLIDSSFSQQKALKNVRRSLDHGRQVTIYFIFEEPRRAWYYTLAREKREGRHVSEEFFVKTYVGSIQIVRQALETFGNEVTVQMMKKVETNNTESPYKFNCIDESLTIKTLDNYIKTMYNEEQIIEMISSKKTE